VHWAKRTAFSRKETQSPTGVSHRILFSTRKMQKHDPLRFLRWWPPSPLWAICRGWKDRVDDRGNGPKASGRGLFQLDAAHPCFLKASRYYFVTDELSIQRTKLFPRFCPARANHPPAPGRRERPRLLFGNRPVGHPSVPAGVIYLFSHQNRIRRVMPFNITTPAACFPRDPRAGRFSQRTDACPRKHSRIFPSRFSFAPPTSLNTLCFVLPLQ